MTVPTSFERLGFVVVPEAGQNTMRRAWRALGDCVCSFRGCPILAGEIVCVVGIEKRPVCSSCMPIYSSKPSKKNYLTPYKITPRSAGNPVPRGQGKNAERFKRFAGESRTAIR